VNTQALTKFMTQLTMPNMSKSMNTRTLNGDSQNVCIIGAKLSYTFQHKSVAKATQQENQLLIHLIDKIHESSLVI
jgi:hypothetical protein